jgi:hypothetical protein
LALGRHVEGFVDAYYGPPDLLEAAQARPPEQPKSLAERARRLLGHLETDAALEPRRRAWLAAQVRGLHTSARVLAGEAVAYIDEIELCYGVRPQPLPDDVLADAHRRLDHLVPGGGPIAERYAAWREAQRVPPARLEAAVHSLAEDLRARTRDAFGLPDGERVDFELTSNQPWSGFNYYLGGFRSRVAINTDLPVLAPHLGRLIAHEAYPGHHTEHARKEAGLVRRRHQLEESIFMVGTPQCLLAEGLADLGFEVIAGPGRHQTLAEHLHPLGIPYDAGPAGDIEPIGEILGAVRGNAAIGLHDRGWSFDQAVEYMQRWALLPRPRAAKSIEFVVDRTWRAYPFCYIDGVRLCRRFVAGRIDRFERLITEQMVPAELAAG